jgi:hypothetical protein
LFQDSRETDKRVKEDLAGVKVTESISRTHRAGQNVSLPEANRLLREGRASEALAAYLSLHKCDQQKIYEDNALFVARRLGLVGARSIEEIREMLSRDPRG